jgi:hypothetical protein
MPSLFGDGFTTGQSIADILYISPMQAPLDPLAEIALRRLVTEAPGEGELDLRDKANKAMQDILSQGQSVSIGRLSSQLNKQGLSDITRTLLSNPNVYGALIEKALGKIPPTDTVGLATFILQEIDGELEDRFSTNILEERFSWPEAVAI